MLVWSGEGRYPDFFYNIYILLFFDKLPLALVWENNLIFFSRFLRHSHDVFQIGTIVVPKKVRMYLEVITYRYVVRTAHSGYVCICHQLEKSKKCSALFILILPNGSVLYNFMLKNNCWFLCTRLSHCFCCFWF